MAQTVLADALASPKVPTDPEELRRWLTGIARHKVADFHRQAMRANARTADSEAVELATAEPVAFEEREILHALLGEKRSRREAETMEWLVREHAGERLADIASKSGVPAAVVRQRVSRLRRALRSRWAGVLGLMVILVGVGAFGLAAYDPREAIAPDPSADPIGDTSDTSGTTAPASAAPDLLKDGEGDWTVASVVPSRALNAAEQRLVDLEAKNAKVRVRGKRIELATKNFKTTWQITSLERTGAGRARIGLKNETGVTDSADVVLARDASGQRLEVTLHGARFGAAVVMRRPTRWPGLWPNR